MRRFIAGVLAASVLPAAGLFGGPPTLAATFPICFRASVTPYDRLARSAIEQAVLTKVVDQGAVIARLTPECASIEGGQI